MKRIWQVALVLLAVVIVVAVIGLLGIDTIAKYGVERGGSYALGVDTRLDSLKLSLLGGELTMNGLRAANPKGFKGQQFMKSGRFELAVRPGSLFTRTVEVDRFELDGLELDIEQRVGGSNVGVILDNLKRLGGEEKKKEQAPGGKKVKVDKILIKNVVARFSLLPELSPAGPITVKVDQIALENVSSDSGGGVVVAELVRRILPAVLKSVLEAGKGLVPDEFLGSVETQLAQTVQAIGGQAEKLLGQVPGQLQKVGKGLGGGAKAAEGAVEKLLGGGKEHDKEK